jgi:type VI secretion system secreted protein VgrG
VSKRKVLEAHQEVLIRCGKSELRMTPDGTIVLKGTNLIVEEEQKMKVTAPRIELN